MYKPNFCADCGAQIHRARWHFWTSRRFCASCARRFRKERFLLPLLLGVMLFGIGLAAGRMAHPRAAPLVFEHAPLPPAPPLAAPAKNGAAQVTGTGTKSEALPTAPKAGPIYGPDGTSSERPTDPDEVVSICGARTKKGTPCQRRVRGMGRCWQHRGLPAMLPPSKLIVQG